jgi:hypothetical protein
MIILEGNFAERLSLVSSAEPNLDGRKFNDDGEVETVMTRCLITQSTD